MEEAHVLAPTRPSARRFHPAALGLSYPGVPDPVSVSELCAVVPPPPLLVPEMDDGRRAFLLSRWYTGAAEITTRQRCWTFRNRAVAGNLLTSKFAAVLLSAAAALLAQEIAPAAWCAFSCDVWKGHEPKKAPPVSWVFALSRIKERREWFLNEAGDYAGGRVVVTKSARKLMRLQYLMRDAIARTCPSDELLREIVDHYFPGDSHTELVERVKAEALVQRKTMAAQVEEGVWLW